MVPAIPNVSPAGIANACRAGDLDAVQAILAVDPSLLGAANPYPWNKAYGGQLYRRSEVVYPIEVATFYGHAELVRWLLTQSPNANLRSRLRTSVGVATDANQPRVLAAITDVVAQFLQESPDRRTSGEGGQLLYMAAEQVCVPWLRCSSIAESRRKT